MCAGAVETIEDVGFPGTGVTSYGEMPMWVLGTDPGSSMGAGSVLLVCLLF